MNPDLTHEEINRFHSKIARSEGCWLWQGQTNNQGYGRFNVYRGNRRIRIFAHRLAYALATGEDLGDAVLRHDCDTPLCCNPQHLRPGTQRDNIDDARHRGRMDLTGLEEQRAEKTQAFRDRLARGEKRCCVCLTVKPLAEFHRNVRENDGHQRRCKACRRAKETRSGGLSERQRRALKREAVDA